MDFGPGMAFITAALITYTIAVWENRLPKNSNQLSL